MSRVLTVQLEWKYSPANYLEDPVFIEFTGGILEIKEGIALAGIDPDIFHNDPSIDEKLSQRIKDWLYAVQIVTHKDFILSKSSRTDIREDGKKNHFLAVEPFTFSTGVSTFDLVIKDEYGNIISDTKRERLESQRKFADLISKYRTKDITLDHILHSYHQAVKDSNNELVYLYEIRDALALKFGSTSNAVKTLQITNNEWSELGRLANNSPLVQGRHRGQSVGTLRNAEPVELDTSRKLALHLITKYLDFLEKNNDSKNP